MNETAVQIEVDAVMFSTTPEYPGLGLRRAPYSHVILYTERHGKRRKRGATEFVGQTQDEVDAKLLAWCERPGVRVKEDGAGEIREDGAPQEKAGR